jgi:DNA polymerase-1
VNKKVLVSLKETQDWFSPCPPVCAVDFETTSLDYMTMQPVGVSFCDGQRACYIDLWENAEANEILDFLRLVFERGLFIGHHLKFDLKCTRKFCHTEPTDIFCTYIASFLLNENRPTHGLKVLVVQDLNVPLKEVQGWEKANTFGYHSEEWYTYSMNDSIWAYHLYERYRPQIEEENLHKVFYEIEMPFIFVCVDMEINGVNVDQQALDDLEFKTRNKLAELEDRMFNSVGESVILQKRMFGEPDERILPINLRSGIQLIKLLKKKCSIHVKDVKKQTIDKLSGKHPFVDYLLTYKKVRKLYDAYITPAFQLIDSDGRIRPSFGIVKTGRTNCRSPNLQQLPNLNKQFSDLNYRSIFNSEDGASLVSGDYSGQELRVLGEVSGDEMIISAFQKGQDLHMVTANYIFDLGLDGKALVDGDPLHRIAKEQYKMERYRAKNGVNFPIVYGAEEYSISKNMNVPVETAKKWKTKFFELYPKVKTAIQETKRELEQNGYVITMMGRKRRFPDYKFLPEHAYGKTPSKSRCIRQAFNFKIQGFSADQIKLAATAARKAGLKILLLIHDELVVESKNEVRSMDARTVKVSMEGAVSLSIPFLVDVKIGDRYNELK